MASHNHWAKTAHTEALIENRRGKLWSKLAKAISVAAKMGGVDPAMNCACAMRLAGVANTREAP